MFAVLYFYCCCSPSNPNNRGKRKPGQRKDIFWKLFGSSETPPHDWRVTLTSLWWRQGWSGGQILAGSLLQNNQSSCPPRRGWSGRQLSPGVYPSSMPKLSRWKAPSPQLPVQHFPKWVLQEPITLDINMCCTEVTYQSQMHLRNAHSQVYSF